MRRRLAALALIFCLALAGCGRGAAQTAIAVPERPAASLPPLEPRDAAQDGEPVPVFFDALLSARGLEKGGACFVPLTPLCRRAGLEGEWSGDEEAFALSIGALRVEGEKGREYLTASGRYLYAPEGWLVRGGELYLSERTADKLFTLTSARDGDGLHFDFSGLSLLRGGENYYELNYPEEELYWLSHIINAEAKFEPLAGQIAVGNVVMNRVKNELFPNTVFEVIYDNEHVIQFEPVGLGGIRQDPTEEAVIASYLVLEGANVVGDCLYFVNPEYGSAWFDSALELRYVIGHHNFYADKD